MRSGSYMFHLILCCVLCAAGCASDAEIRAANLQYINSESGFGITFPENWQSYKIIDSTEYIAEDIKVQAFLVCLPTRSRDWQSDRVSGQYAVMFTILIFPAASWELYTARYSGVEIRNKVLGRSEKNVFVMRYCSGLPIDLYQYMKEIDKVAAKFSVIEKK